MLPATTRCDSAWLGRESGERPRSLVRPALAASIALVLLLAAGWVFWYEDWRYSLPTPRPANLVQPELDTSLATTPEVARILGGAAGRPTLIHVFNPSCPCSRFNVDHLRDLVKRFSERVHFVALLETDDPSAALRRFEALDLEIPAFADVDDRIASALGVYSTPQAVLVRADGSLFFRGNYNRTRFCDDQATEFARLALEAVTAGKALPELPPEATLAYGCELPEPSKGAVEGN